VNHDRVNLLSIFIFICLGAGYIVYVASNSLVW